MMLSSHSSPGLLLYLDQWSLMWGDFVLPGNIWQRLKTILIVVTGDGGGGKGMLLPFSE